VLLPLLNEGDRRAIQEVANYFLKASENWNHMWKEDNTKIVSRTRFFEMLPQEDDEELQWNGSCWSAIVAGRWTAQAVVKQWLGEEPKDVLSRIRYNTILRMNMSS
jgi:hypothetical protein